MLSVAAILLIASAMLGLMTGLVFKVWSLIIISPLTAIVSATVLRSYGFGFATGVLVTVGCLVVSQIGYLVAVMQPYAISIQDECDGAPGDDGQQNVHEKDE